MHHKTPSSFPSGIRQQGSRGAILINLTSSASLTTVASCASSPPTPRSATSPTVPAVSTNVILRLADSQRTGQDHGVDVFLSLFPLEVPDAVEKYLGIASGKLFQIPPVDSLSGFGLELRRVYMPSFELGFERGSRINSVVNGSRVQEAGLRVGDWVVNQTNPNWAADKVERNLITWVRRGSEKKEMEITFWPRTRYNVQGYQWFVTGES
ncbi:hypothetical protein MMC27_008466 [Xylographa pallens]|nr:hypothetical protein [Xylographa pallens]